MTPRATALVTVGTDRARLAFNRSRSARRPAWPPLLGALLRTPPDDRLHRWRPDAALEPVAAPEDDDEPGGCHTGGGVTVADLIAKVGAPNRPVHRRAAREETEPFEPEPVEPEPEPPGPASGLPLELQQTQVIDDLAYSVDAVSELRELMATDYPNDGDSDQQSADAADTAAGEPGAGAVRC